MPSSSRSRDSISGCASSIPSWSRLCPRRFARHAPRRCFRLRATCSTLTRRREASRTFAVRAFRSWTTRELWAFTCRWASDSSRLPSPSEPLAMSWSCIGATLPPACILRRTLWESASRTASRLSCTRPSSSRCTTCSRLHSPTTGACLASCISSSTAYTPSATLARSFSRERRRRSSASSSPSSGASAAALSSTLPKWGLLPGFLTRNGSPRASLTLKRPRFTIMGSRRTPTIATATSLGIMGRRLACCSSSALCCASSHSSACAIVTATSSDERRERRASRGCCCDWLSRMRACALCGACAGRVRVACCVRRSIGGYIRAII
eukprot:Opistho-1_new@46002